MGDQENLPLEIFELARELGELRLQIDIALFEKFTLESEAMNSVLIDMGYSSSLPFLDSTVQRCGLHLRLAKHEAFLKIQSDLRTACGRRDYVAAMLELKRSQFQLFVLELEGALQTREERAEKEGFGQ